MNEDIKPAQHEALLENLVVCQRYALLGRLSTVVAHELNNQLTGVSGYAQLLLANDAAEPFAKELDKIRVSAARCRQLIEKIRLLGRFSGGQKELNNINLILGASLDLIRHQYERKSCELVEELSPDVPSIEVDTPAIEQAFLNVMQNALEAFVGKGGRLTVRTEAEDGKIVATFDDNGPGLSEAARANLFTPFFTTKPDLKCPGLGLAATKMVIEDHGGTVKLDASAAGGVRVVVTLPLEPAG